MMPEPVAQMEKPRDIRCPGLYRLLGWLAN